MSKVRHNPDASKHIDEYINSLPDFSRAICKKLRSIILNADKSIIEDWKWGPNYYSKGMVCGYGGFKKHVAFGFFQGALMKDPDKIFEVGIEGAVHNRRIYFSDIKQVNEKVLSAYVKEAVSINEKGLKAVNTNKTVIVPEDLNRALKKNKLLKKFETMSYYNRKDYAQWIEGAKRAETKERRIEDAMVKIEKGEGLNDKYKKVS